MRQQHLFGLATFHTHPGASPRVWFSPYDDEEDPQLVANLREIDGDTQLLSMVVGKESQAARLWLSPTSYVVPERLTLVGDTVSFHALTGEPGPEPPEPAAVFDRALTITGRGALAALATMRIAVIGASGTGSLVCELLVRAGCTKILTIDNDVVKDVNLNRVLHANANDARQHTPKVEVMKRAIEGLGLGCTVEAIDGNVLDRETLKHLRSADLIIGCVDKALPRRLLCQFSYRYLIPYIDVGSEIGGDEGGIVSVDARTSYVAPGYPCLMCQGVVTPRQLGFESSSYEEQRRQLALGYSDDLVIVQPAVMDLNMRAASFGVMYLRHLLQPFLVTPLPGEILESVVNYACRRIDNPRAFSATCRTCQTNTYVGYGDRAASLGLAAADLASISPPK